MAASGPKGIHDACFPLYLQNLMAQAQHLDNIRQALQRIDPLHTNVHFRNFQARIDQLQSECCEKDMLHVELEMFVSENIADCTSQLWHLGQFLHSVACSQESKFDINNNTKSRIVSRCLWKLIKLSGNSGETTVVSEESGASSLQLSSAHCLGELGPVCSHLIAFSSHVTREHDGDSSDESARNMRVLLLLDTYQVDSSVQIVRCARQTLRALLNLVRRSDTHPAPFYSVAALAIEQRTTCIQKTY